MTKTTKLLKLTWSENRKYKNEIFRILIKYNIIWVILKQLLSMRENVIDVQLMMTKSNYWENKHNFIQGISVRINKRKTTGAWPSTSSSSN